MKVRQQQIDQSEELLKEMRLYRRDMIRFSGVNIFLMFLAWFTSGFSIHFLIGALIFLGVYVAASIICKQKSKRVPAFVYMYQLIKLFAVSGCFLLMTVNVIQQLHTGRAGIFVSLMICILYITLIIHGIFNAKRKREEVLEPTGVGGQEAKSIGSAAAVLGILTGRLIFSEMEQEKSVLFVVFLLALLSCMIAAQTKQFYWLYLNELKKMK